jgi:hypothetical protein
MRYCDFEPGEFEETEFEPVRGNLFLHVQGREPLHTNDGAPWDEDPVIGPSGPVIGPDAEPSE